MRTPVRHLFSSACTVLFALGCTVGAIAGDSPELENNRHREALNAMQGQPAPALALRDWINSRPLTLDDLKGKIVVLDFWATWCGPCLAAVPHTNDLMEKYKDRGVIFVGACAAKGSEKMADTVKQRGIRYPVAVDANDATFKAYKADSYPDYFVIDRAGRLRWGDVKNSEVEKAIEILLNEK